MLKIVKAIEKAQDGIVEQYGMEGYKKIINKLRVQTDNCPVAFPLICKDKEQDSIIRLGALACLGEDSGHDFLKLI